jgi:predicted nuclease with TOPRIM domain
MITKGVSHIGGIRSLQSRPGQNTESGRLLKLHQLAAEKENLMKKLAWIKGQQDQTEKRLSEIALAMQAIEEKAGKKAKREPVSHTQTGLRKTFIEY